MDYGDVGLGVLEEGGVEFVKLGFEFGRKDTKKVSILSGKWIIFSDSAEFKSVFLGLFT